MDVSWFTDVRVELGSFQVLLTPKSSLFHFHNFNINCDSLHAASQRLTMSILKAFPASNSNVKTLLGMIISRAWKLG